MHEGMFTMARIWFLEVSMEKRLSVTFGLLIGVIWMAEICLANLVPAARHVAEWCALAAVAITMIAGYVAARESGSIVMALRVGVWSGLLSGGMLCVTGIGIVVLFHGVMMRDPSSIHEFALHAHRAPTQGELSRFLYDDMVGGALNHLWLGPLLGLTVGAAGALAGKYSR